MIREKINARSVILSSVLLSIMTSTALKAEEWRFSTGVGVYSTNGIWTESDAHQGVVPILSAHYGAWSFGDESLVSYQLFDNDEFGVAAGINYRNDGYDAGRALGSIDSDSEIFDGYDSPDGDLTFKVDSYWRFVKLNLEQDISGHSKGLTADLGVEVPLFKLGNKFKLKAEAGIHWQSRDYSQHIYGVSSEQVDNSVERTAYEINSTLNYSAGLTAFYQLNRNWSLFSKVRYTKLDDEISESPLVDRDSSTTLFLGATYNF